MYGVIETTKLYQGLPEGIGELRPGAGLGMLLESVDRDRLSGYDRIELVRARVRLKAHVEAELMADLVAVMAAEEEAVGGELPIDELFDLAAAEVAAALAWTRRSSQRQLSFAMRLVGEYPTVWAALREGNIDYPKARVIVDQTGHLDPDVRRRVVETILPRAPRLTTGLLRSRIRRLVIWADPAEARKRLEEGLAERRVVGEENQDGTANLHGLGLSPRSVQAMLRRINRLARKAKKAGDSRTMDQIRADLLVELVCGANHHRDQRDRGVVDIRVDLTTLLGLDESPGDLPGWGPVVSDIARQAVEAQADSEWRYTVTGEDGRILATGTTQRRPTAAQRRRVEAESESCVFPPGCPFPALDCDLDHNQPWSEGGRTEDANLGPLCRHHHVVRHHGWTLKQLQPGVYQFTSPLGHTYTTNPRGP